MAAEKDDSRIVPVHFCRVTVIFLLKSFNLLNINNMHNFLYINLFINLIPPTDF